MPISNLLIQIIGVIVVFGVAIYGLQSGRLAVQLGLLAAPFIFFLINNPSVWLIVILGLIQSKLIFPGIPQGLHVVHVMMAGFTAMMLARNCIVKTNSPRWLVSDYFLFGFIAVLIITALHRGIGIRALGGGQWGGMGYIKLLVSAGFLITAKYVILSQKQIRIAIILMIALSLLPFFAQTIFTLSGGKIYHQYMFVEAYASGLLSSLEASESGGGVVRIQGIGGLAFSILMAAIVLIKPEGMRKAVIGGACLLAIALAGLSGFRGQILLILGTLTLYAIFSSRSSRWQRLLLAGAIAFVGLLLMYPLMSYLPPAVQRAFSFLPGADIPIYIQMDAQHSSYWRTQVWRLAWNEVPDYLWIGKGFSFNPNETMSFSVTRDTILQAFLSHNYHSGPLTLLLDLGVPGLVFGSGFLLFSALEIYRTMDRITTDPVMERFYRFMAACYIYSIPSFFLIFGDARESFSLLFVWLAMLKAVQLSNAAIATSQRKAEAAALAAPVIPLKPVRRYTYT